MTVEVVGTKAASEEVAGVEALAAIAPMLTLAELAETSAAEEIETGVEVEAPTTGQ
jgi:hypothetical protein